jgi:ring-1,2-phenylacetyl-CoA epoxidase subunit PaaD
VSGPARTSHPVTAEAVWAALAEVPDPEIPVISLVDLGVINRVQLDPEQDAIRVELLPTFVGCPAIEQMRAAATERLASLAARVEVEVTFAEPWTSDRITAEGRRKLSASGFAPPAQGAIRPAPLIETIAVRPGLRRRSDDAGGRGPSEPVTEQGTDQVGDQAGEPVACPWCGSGDTELDNPFGPTLCRAIHWCRACRQPFERFKRV